MKRIDSASTSRRITEYLVDVLERAHALEDVARRLALSEDYVSAEVPLLIGKLADAGELVRRAALQQFTRYQATQKSADLTLLHSFDRALQEIFLDIRLPERARSDRVPGVLPRLVSEKARELTPGAGVILRPQWRYNYKIYRDDVQTRYRTLLAPVLANSQAVDDWLSGLPNPLYVISFPLVEQKSIHMHALLGHELGHLVAREYVAPAAASDRFERDLRAERLAFLRRSRPDLKETHDDDLLDADVELDRSIGARRAAIKEYASDAASLYLIGIPALLATAQLASSRHLSQSRESPGGTYPTWGNRLFYMLQLANNLGWPAQLQQRKASGAVRKATTAVYNYYDELLAWVGKTASWRVADPWVARGHAAAEQLLPDIHQFIATRIGASIVDPQRSLEALQVLLGRLSRSIPPDNVNARELPFQPAALDQIFLASWAFRLSSPEPTFNSADVDEPTRSRVEQLRRLTLKAIENVDFYTRFRPEIDKRSMRRGSSVEERASQATKRSRSRQASRDTPPG